MNKAYVRFFQTAFNSSITPYPFQEKLALEAWPDTLDVGTGLGKTAGVTLAWLFKRQQNDPHTPRRLIYCLPRRVLVEQTAKDMTIWLKNLTAAGFYSSGNTPAVFTLMGGHIDRDWDCYPDKDAIIVGTQDQLLSRALNRGYAMSRFRWPVQFGLLHNDCLWVFDEVQLMGVGLKTSAQLEAFRQSLGTCIPCRSLWMSATIRPEWLASVDFAKNVTALTNGSLKDADKADSCVLKLINAPKRLSKALCDPLNAASVAKFILEHHKPGTRTIAVVNTVKRAQEIYSHLLTLSSKQHEKPALCLLHSRFRPPERQSALDVLLEHPAAMGTICVATEVIEAGIDVSSRTLITDLASWPSLIQRFGRNNRKGEYADAEVFWLDVIASGKGHPEPYTIDLLMEAKNYLQRLEGASVCQTNLPPVSQVNEPMHVLRRKDVIDLFDTTQDLSGRDIDVSRFIREANNHDVQVFWRNIGAGESPASPNDGEPTKEELCNVPIGDLKDRRCWVWNHLDKTWDKPSTLVPGIVIMVRQADGGYNTKLGWTGKSNDLPTVSSSSLVTPDSDSDDTYSETVLQTLADHTNCVLRQMDSILNAINISQRFGDDLRKAACWHDVGKSHEVSQEAFAGGLSQADTSKIWAKTAKKNIIYSRRGFRHELASALALLENGHSDLSAYLAAAHHGKVRLSIRSFPHENKPPNGQRFARGIWDGDMLPEAMLGNNEIMPKTTLTLAYMELGETDKGASWLSRTLRLRDSQDVGPFRLAFLEAILRCSDWRGSKEGVED